MKSTIFSILPIAGLAAAESYCSVQTYTKTEYETVYETATAAKVADVTATKSSTCSRPTVTATTYEKVYVTVTAPGYGSMPPKPSTSTSTVEDYVTVTVRPSASECAATPSSAPLASASPSPSEAPLPSFQLASSPAAKATSESKTPVAYPTAASSTVSAAAAAVSPSASASASPAPTSSSAGSKRGEATFYGGNLDGGMCSLTGYTLPSGLFGTALTDSDWDSANACGTCVSVTGPSGDKITAMVVDQCPGCGPHHLDLFPDAFKKLADPSKGIIPVSWEVVPCGITTPIVLKNKSGTSAHWFSMQVMNSNVQVTSLDVSTDGGKTWKGTKRQPYNFFENSAGFGTDSVDVKITSSGGQSIIVKGVSVAANTTKTCSSNFA
ncbi:carbohydrate-binding module family 63 protein [Bipolaris victoriae FI3]|uniref:Carbohydrate-binding module family 63 protein n=1 Tax=Bipolaris victoriae (strain FI3) TaxID=930091 RepID=W7EI35_BIPV3|nr:carbohydrate-binding module family 63 protein [Bipolaris victoriae FI3]